MRKLYLLLSFFLSFSLTFSQAPEGYYDGTEGLRGQALLDKLTEIITNGHTQNSYSDLYTYYEKTDRVPGTNKVWDMYSMDGNCNAQYYYYFGNGQECGTYSQEGDCYNREHTLPASWFDDNYPMYADLFIVYPTDGYVNNRRSNYPYGQVDSPTWTSTNGSKLGPNSYPGGPDITVFEPIDAYKGDLARTYFYIACRYQYDIPNWDFSTNLAYVFNSDGTLQEWAKQMFLEWCKLDPVSEKEIARNDSVYKIQGNRNPFIDHPEFIDYIWGDSSSTAQTDTIYFESFSSCPPAGWQTFAPSGSNGWSCSDYGYMSANAYGASAASDDWLVSPKIDATTYSNVTLTFRTYTRYSDDGVSYPPLSVYYSTDYDGTSDPSAATWTQISWNYPAEDSQTWTGSGDISLDVSQPFYLAFHYVSSGTGAGSSALWEVDNVTVTGQKVTTVQAPLEEKTFKVNIFPNPTINGIVTVEVDLPKQQDVNIDIFSIDGKLLGHYLFKNQPVSKNFYKLNLSDVSDKLVVIRISTPQNVTVKKLIIN